MRAADQVAGFVANALTAGRSRSEIAAALSAAGWTASEVSAALEAWATTDFSPPVPRPRPYVSARDAFLYGLMFAALAMTSWYITDLGFALIDRWLPELTDPESYGYDNFNWTVRWSIATLVVTLPVFLVLNVRATRAARSDPAKRRSVVRKWFGYITLFLAAVALAGDLIATIYSLLNGDLSARVASKAALVAVTAGLIFMYYHGELEGGPDAP